ncbi:MAG: nuclear transport factor 2 family protein [Acidobacteria bacterium]|nr:nuclear transport factor 2 family protein [Acidobacteriota bacterium]
MKKLTILIFILASFAAAASGQGSKDAGDLLKLLGEFLDGAGRNDAAIHDRFWADELIYTRGVGQRIGKEELMRGVRSAPPAKPTDAVTLYNAEDVRIQIHGNTAVVAFQLVGKTINGGKTTVTNHLNTGTFVKRDGRWQAIAWQATPMRKTDAEAKAEVLAAEKTLQDAIAKNDAKTVRELAHPTFNWTHSTGQATPLEPFIETYLSGKVRFSNVEYRDLAVSVYGDTAVVRGVSPRVLNRENSPAERFVLHYTITFINSNGRWLAVAAHSSRSEK